MVFRPVETLQHSWEKVKRALEQDLPESMVAPLHPIQLPESDSDRRLVLGVSDRTLLPLLRERYGEKVRLRMKSLMGREVRIEFRPTRSGEDGPTFENFLEGRSNRMALQAARTVAAKPAPGGPGGPLFLYGPPGVGKSHLSAALEHLARTQGFAVLSVEADSVRKQGGVPDVLILDRHRADGSQWNQRLILLVSQCYERGAQIVATGRSPVSAMDVPDPIRAILHSGIQIRLDPPELQLRHRFLQREFEQAGVELSTPLREELVSILPADFAQLRAAARKIAFLCLNSETPHTSATLRKNLAEFLVSAPESTTPGQILERVAATFNVTTDDILGTSRRAHLTLPRHVAMHLAVELTDLNKSAVARFFRRNDHSTVINAEKNIRRRIARDPAFAQALTELRQQLV